MPKILVEIGSQVLEQHGFSKAARVGLVYRGLGPECPEALPVVRSAKDELSYRFIELLRLNLRVKQTAIFSVVFASKIGDSLCRERIAFKTPLRAQPDNRRLLRCGGHFVLL